MAILEKNMGNSELQRREYLQCKGEWENLIRKKTSGIILRSKAKWVEEGEKNTKYFLNLEKRNYDNKYIKTLKKENEEISDQKEILEMEQQFYSQLYTTKLNQEKLEELNNTNFTSIENIPKLNEEDKSTCEEPLSMEECGKALKELPNNKSPGGDGFTTNFYKFFWCDIKTILYDSYMYSFEKGALTPDQKRGILNLLPKTDKDLRYLANWRPVSLLNTDYKILTKALALRLQKVIPKIINTDQVGYIKGRYIGENIRTLFDLINHAKFEQLEAYIAQIDFEKAFDSIEWPFLLKTMKLFNFGDDFIKWIKILYTDIQACVGNNGTYSPYFKLTRSIRQGCPISALLFLLVAEIIAIDIRNDSEIKGIKLDNTEFKISMMADDTTLSLIDIKSVEIAIRKFMKFEKYSGLKLNLGKTILIPIGKCSGKDIKLPDYIKKITVKNGAFKALGIWFSENENEIEALNIDDRTKKMETMMNIWTGRSLSLKGKITIIRTLILTSNPIFILFNSDFNRNIEENRWTTQKFLMEQKTFKNQKKYYNSKHRKWRFKNG